MVTSTLTVDGFADAVVMAPENSVKWPRTLLIRWRTLKPTSECAGVDGPGADAEVGGGDLLRSWGVSSG